MKKIINKLFPVIRQIKSKTGILHFIRWNIFSSKYFNIYLHKITQADLDKHLHNHPWNFISWLIYGSYTEKLLGEFDEIIIQKRKLFSIIYRNKKQFHKILKLNSPIVYTIVFTGKKNEPNDFDWGYEVNGHFINRVKYRKMKNNGELI